MINRFCKKPLLECSFQPASLCGGATRRTPSCCPHPTCFNPRDRESSSNHPVAGDRDGGVSTHEPMRARRLVPLERRLVNVEFQPASP